MAWPTFGLQPFMTNAGDSVSMAIIGESDSFSPPSTIPSVLVKLTQLEKWNCIRWAPCFPPDTWRNNTENERRTDVHFRIHFPQQITKPRKVCFLGFHFWHGRTHARTLFCNSKIIGFGQVFVFLFTPRCIDLFLTPVQIVLRCYFVPYDSSEKLV